MRKTKYLLLTQHWLSAKGGITTRFVTLIEGIQKRGILELSIITADPYKDKNIFNVFGRNKIVLFVTTLLALFRISPDIIHCAEHGYMLLTAVCYKCLKPKVKIVFSFHTDRGVKPANYIQNSLLNWAINRCDRVLSNSAYLFEKTVKERGLNIKRGFMIFPSAVVIKKCQELQIIEAKHRFGLKDRYPILCTIGVFEHEGKIEGMKLLLNAFKKMDLPKGKVIIVGDGKYRKSLEECISTLAIFDKVVITGYLENPYPVLAISDIYCHLAANEAFGIAILEAMAMGKPIVAVKRGGIPELIRDGINGLLIEPTVPEVAKAITILLNDGELREKISYNAKIIAENEYNIGKCIDRYIDILSETIGCESGTLK